MRQWYGVNQEERKRRGMSAIEENASRNAKETMGNVRKENKDAKGKGKKGWLVMRVLEVEIEGKEVGMMKGRV